MLSFGTTYADPASRLPRTTLYTMNVTSGHFRRRSTFLSPYSASGTVWSPRGRSLLYLYTRGTKLELHALELPRGRDRNLTPGLIALGASWSPDARRIAFWTRARPGRRSAVLTMNADGTDKRLLVPDATAAAWSPQGGRIAFFRAADRPASLWIAGASGDGVRKLAAHARPPALWSPSGEALMFLREPRRRRRRRVRRRRRSRGRHARTPRRRHGRRGREHRQLPRVAARARAAHAGRGAFHAKDRRRPLHPPARRAAEPDPLAITNPLGATRPVPFGHLARLARVAQDQGCAGRASGSAAGRSGCRRSARRYPRRSARSHPPLETEKVKKEKSGGAGS